MKRRPLIAALMLALACCAPAAPQNFAAVANVSPSAPNIVAALADTSRPEQDRTGDAARHPAEILALAEAEPGDRVVDVMPGGGYFTRLFSLAVGETGQVYPLVRPHGSIYEVPVAVDDPNVTNVREPYDSFRTPEPVDLVFNSMTYHDMRWPENQMGDPVAMNRAAFAALKPGGVYLLIDHYAPDGMPAERAMRLHRIDPATLRQEVESAGFVYDGESDLLRNPSDPRTASVFDESIRGHTDRFIMRFRKPD